MNYEFNDYRSKRPEEDIGKWPFYYIPSRFVGGWVLKSIFFFWVLPMLLWGSWFGSLSTFFLYFILYDVLEYSSLKQRIKNGQ
jgi:hypothetical protein